MRALDAVTACLSLMPALSVVGAGHGSGVVGVLVWLLSVPLAVLVVHHLTLPLATHTPVRAEWSLGALAAVCYLPMLLAGRPWGASAGLLAACALAALPWRRSLVVVLVVVALDASGSLLVFGQRPMDTVYGTLQVLLTAAVLAALAWTVRITLELNQLRIELVSTAVLRERLRMSRDLHDVLGRGLAAISLKAELARRYQERGLDAETAAELDQISNVAAQCGDDLRALVTGYRNLSLESEIDVGLELLEEAGIECQVRVDAHLAAPTAVSDTLAWVVREGVTNVLKHSRATRCRLTAERREGHLVVTVHNDGADLAQDGAAVPDPRPAPGNGLRGLHERVAASGGTVSAAAGPDGTWTLVVALPTTDDPALTQEVPA
ncbi:sensor histidine kinase [Cellulomonas sp. P22]|uniref:sensor histidine kinase n=1 Tax=Cellulomonas sp. P22 TaxID=3373189 RepID=UPI0037940191